MRQAAVCDLVAMHNTFCDNVRYVRKGNNVERRKGTTIAVRQCKFRDEAKCIAKQDKVNNADSAFIFLIIQSQNQWSGWSGRRRWPCLVWSLLER